MIFNIMLETDKGTKRLLVAVADLDEKEAEEEAVSAAFNAALEIGLTVTEMRSPILLGGTKAEGTPIPQHPRARLVAPHNSEYS